MSLSTLLLPSHGKGKATGIDSELDALFKTTPVAPPPKPKPSVQITNISAADESTTPEGSGKKRKLDAPDVEGKKGKKFKAESKDSRKGMGKREGGTKAKRESLAEDQTGKKSRRSKKEKGDKIVPKRARMDDEGAGVDSEEEEVEGHDEDEDEDEDADEDNSDLENAYYQQKMKEKSKATRQKPPHAEVDNASEEDEQESSDEVSDGNDAGGESGEESEEVEEESNSESSDDEGDPSKLVHETLRDKKASKRSSKPPKQKYVPPDETSEQRDERTIFVGNLSIEVAEKRSLLKQLHRHLLARLPGAKIESTRFRSIAFQNPTNKLPGDEEADSSKPKPKVASSVRQHDLERISAWREHENDKRRRDQELLKKDEKKYLTPAQKKKIAFIHHEFHESAASVNAYIVFAHHPPVADESGSKASKHAEAAMSPYEAAKKAVELFDGTVYQERMLRVDLALRGRGRTAKLSDGTVVSGAGDPKLTVFVGNLDFESKEEDLRTFFEGIVAGERGPPPEADEEDDDDEGALSKHKGWVRKVRIVRDKDTQLGKGFAYVQFADKQCVDEILAMEEGTLKFAKRKLRVQRCKTLPGVSTKDTKTTSGKAKGGKASKSAKPGAPTPRKATSSTPIVIPKGNPELGARLAGLSKDERKKLKASDPERLARRMAKKKARAALGNPGVDMRNGSAKEKKQRTRTWYDTQLTAGGVLNYARTCSVYLLIAFDSATNMAPVTNGRILFKSIPKGYPKPGQDVAYDTSEMIDPDKVELNGGFLVKTLVVSIDPYFRGQMRPADVKDYAPPFLVDKPIFGFAVGLVVRSENPAVKAGDHVYGWLPYEEYSVHKNMHDDEGPFKLIVLDNKYHLPWSVYVGAAGMPGETAYMGWKEYAHPKKGETAFISSGASGVGSLVIQLAKQDGLKVIASAGSEEKLKFMKDLGADVVFNYKDTDVKDVLAREGPVDIYWDNVGGKTLDAALEASSVGARFIECGQISAYNTDVSVKNMLYVVSRGLSMNGFIVIWLEPKYIEEFHRVVPAAIAEGKFKFAEELTEGLSNVPQVILDVQQGRNKAKSVVVVAKE
ncbi:hypothetical protein AX16_001543 [Volvariella volvacea WC 439]|nr:hypothetical protein AX16_001543 [Volvariella volvacea WC 439]